jgi:hypothetical protein
VLAVRTLLLKCCTFIIAERKSPSLEAERSFQVLHPMADNPECLGYLLRGLLTHIPSLLHLLQKLNETTLHRSMAALLHNLLKVQWNTSCVYSIAYSTDMPHKQNCCRIIEINFITDSLIYAKRKCGCTQRPCKSSLSLKKMLLLIRQPLMEVCSLGGC